MDNVKSCITQALDKCDHFRKTEGKVLEKMLKECCSVIYQELKNVELLDPKRDRKSAGKAERKCD